MVSISIITAVRNAAAAVPHTLRSIAAQDYPDYEHVVVDGASTDDTVEIVRMSGSRKLNLISERDTGIYDAFNKGVRLARCDVIGFLNAGDTYASPQSLSRIAGAFSDPQIDAVFGDVVIVDAEHPEVVVRRYDSARFSPAQVGYGIMPAHPTLYMRRSVYEKFGLYDASYRIAGDFELVARVFVGGKIRYRRIDEVLVRMPRGGVSTSGPRATYTITREMRRACAQNGISTNYFKLVSRLVRKATEYLRPGA
jgi:glycosyltransferase involved in cell wall biosynthesis